MAGEFHCELYIDTDESIEDVEKAVSSVAGLSYGGLDIETVVYKNDDYDSLASYRVPYHFIEASRYYVEVALVEELEEDIPAFRNGTVELVRTLRDGNRFVSVACDFEDLIKDLTGWNWSKDQPEPPGRVVKTRPD